MTSSVAAIRNRRDNRLLGDAYDYITRAGSGVERSMVVCLKGSNCSPDIRTRASSDCRTVLLAHGTFAVDESAWCLLACRRLHARSMATAPA